MNLTLLWLGRRLSSKDIREYIEREGRALGLDMTQEDIAEVTRLCYVLYKRYHGDYHFLGSFLTAVVNNDLMNALGSADDTNRRCLILYCSFLYNVAPGDWRERMRE